MTSRHDEEARRNRFPRRDHLTWDVPGPGEAARGGEKTGTRLAPGTSHACLREGTAELAVYEGTVNTRPFGALTRGGGGPDIKLHAVE